MEVRTREGFPLDFRYGYRHDGDGSQRQAGIEHLQDRALQGLLRGESQRLLLVQ